MTPDPYDLPKFDRTAFEEGSVSIERSGWLPVNPLPRLNSLETDIEADVVVIGAGLAGASTFLHLLESGTNAVLVEAGQPANGASGRNAGHYLPYLDDVETFKEWPDGKGQRFLDFAVANRNIVYDICGKYGLRVDCKQLGMVVAAQRAQKDVVAKASFWRQHGYQVDQVGRDELVAMLGTDHFGFGLVWREGGRMNPYLFTNGMVSAAVLLGGRAYGDSPVVTCTAEGAGWRVRTASGSVVTRQVVVCTGGNKGNGFFPELGQTSYPMVGVALATKPLPDELAKKLMPSGAIVEQYPGLYHMLLDERNRLISSTVPGIGKAHDANLYFKVFVDWIKKAFPVARDYTIELESYWSGMMYNSSYVYQRGYPKVYKAADGVYALLNLGSWGNFMGPMLGKSLGQAIAANAIDDFVLPIEKPNHVRWPGRFNFTIRRFTVPAGRIADRLGLI